MRRRVFTCTFVLAMGALSAATVAYFCIPPNRDAAREPSFGRVDSDLRDEGTGGRCLAHGKIRPPAEVSIGVAEIPVAGGPVTLVISASSLVPVDRGLLTLRVPQIGSEPNRVDVLWAAAPLDFVGETIEYPLGILPVGQYCFSAVLEFLPEGENTQEVALSDSLYLDVRPTGTLFSNVSFEHIERVELRRELERRIVASLRPALGVAAEDDITRELARLEAANPGFTDRQIQALAATDPNVARRIMELNEHSGELAVETDSARNPDESTETRLVPSEDDAPARQR
jgi:hypothetical protein